MKLHRRRLLSGIAAAGLVLVLAPAVAPTIVRADDDDEDGKRGDYRNGSGYRNNHENRPNGNPSGNNITDQPGMSYQQSVEAGGESRETVHESPVRPAQDWLKEAMSGNATEIAAGALAAGRGASADIRQFGQRMVTDHSMELDKLIDLALKYGVDPIRDPVMPEQKQLIHNLMLYEGQDFDRFYARSMVLEHQTDIHHYEMGTKEQPKPIAAHALDTLPILRDHLAMIQDIAGKVGADLSGT
jgi:putative membrane protein